MFEIFLSDITPGKTYPGIDAKVSLLVGGDTLIEKREFSIYKAIDNILKRIENPKGLGSSEPIFICSCGEVPSTKLAYVMVDVGLKGCKQDTYENRDIREHARNLTM